MSRLPFSARFFYGWVIVLISSLGIFFSGPGQTYGVSIFVDPLIQTFGWSRSLVSSLYSAGTLAAGLIVGSVGHLVDRRGHRTMLTAIAVLFGGACLFMSFVASPAMLFVGFMLIRLLGQGSMTLTSSTMVPQWFVRNRGKAMSLVALGGAISTALIPPLNAWLIQTWDWRIAWQVWAALLWLVMAPLAWYLVRGRPEEVGLLPDNQPATALEAGGGLPEEVSWTLPEAMRTRAFWLMLFCSGIPSMINTGMTFHHVSILGARGLSTEVAATVFTIAALIHLPINFVAGWVLDRIPVRYVMAGTMTGQLLIMVWVLYTGSFAMAVGYGVLRGLVGAFEGVIGGVLWANYYGRRSLATIRGVSFTVMVVGSALGPLPFGVAFDLFSGYTEILLFMMLFPVLGFAAALASPPPHRAPSAGSESAAI